MESLAFHGTVSCFLGIGDAVKWWSRHPAPHSPRQLMWRRPGLRGAGREWAARGAGENLVPPRLCPGRNHPVPGPQDFRPRPRPQGADT